MYLVIGGTGFIGQYLIKNILKHTNEDIIATQNTVSYSIQNSRLQWEKCNISLETDLQKLALKIKNMQNIKVFFLAAYHHPDEILKNPQIAWDINITSLARFLNIFNNIKSLYYSSTEVVYGHSYYSFNEKSYLSPLSRYGELKVIAEQMIIASGFNVVRFPVLIGSSLNFKKKHFYDIIIENLQQGKSIKMFSDQKRSMLDFDTASHFMLKLINEATAKQYPIVNIAGDEVLSKYHVALKIAHKHNLQKDLVIPISIENDKSIFTEKRALITLLDNALLKNIFNLIELKIKI